MSQPANANQHDNRAPRNTVPGCPYFRRYQMFMHIKTVFHQKSQHISPGTDFDELISTGGGHSPSFACLHASFYRYPTCPRRRLFPSVRLYTSRTDKIQEVPPPALTPPTGNDGRETPDGDELNNRIRLSPPSGKRHCIIAGGGCQGQAPSGWLTLPPLAQNLTTGGATAGVQCFTCKRVFLFMPFCTF